MKVDLHIHTSYSDGAFSPEKIVDTAIDAELGAIAITDHDNVLSYKIAQEYAKDKSLEVLPGVEINTIYKGYEVHILGYFMDLNNSDFQKLIKSQQQARIKQTHGHGHSIHYYGIGHTYYAAGYVHYAKPLDVSHCKGQ